MVPGIRRNPPPIVHTNVDGDIQRRLVTYEQQEPKYRQEINILRQQVELLTHRAEQLSAERDNAHYNTQIWQRRVEEQQELIGERDKAIANLVRHSYDCFEQNDGIVTEMTGMCDLKNKYEELKEQHERDQEQIVRQHKLNLKQKNKTIEDLVQQVHLLESYKKQFTSAQSSQVANLIQEVERLRTALKLKEEDYISLQSLVKRTENEYKEVIQERSNVERDGKLQHLQTENEAQASELRELKRHLWKAKESCDEIVELKKALAEAQEQVRTLEMAKQNATEVARRQLDEEIQSELLFKEKTQQCKEELTSDIETSREAASAPSVGPAVNVERKECIAQLEKKVLELTKRVDSKSTILQSSQRKVKRLEAELGNAKVQIDLLLDEKTSIISQLGHVSLELENKTQQLDLAETSAQQLCDSLNNAELELSSISQAAIAEHSMLRDQLECSTISLSKAEATIRELKSNIKEAKSIEETLRAQMMAQPVGGGIPSAFDQAQKSLQESETSIINVYERRLLDLSLEKDATIGDLRKDMTALRERRSEEVSDLNREVASLRSKLEEIHDECDQELKRKDQHIYALEHTLHAQEQTMDIMRTEMDQLQSSMQAAASTRRSELEDLQQEVIVLRAQLSKQDKEVSSLRIQLKDEQLEHRAAELGLKEAIAQLENEVPKFKAMARIENDKRMMMVKERLDQLRIRNNELKEENKQLGERLEKGIIKINALEAKCSQADYYKIECGILRRQLAELEEVLEQNHNFAEVSSLPDIETAAAPVKGKHVMTWNFPADHKQREIGKPKNKPFIRLFSRRKFISSSSAVLAADEKEFRP